jgi:hypothetical protein
MKFDLTVFRSTSTRRHAALASALLLLCAGCQSFNRPPANNLASVTITDRTMPQIATAIQAVFATHYFQGGQTGPYEFTYQRPGNRMNNLAYGSYFFDEKVTVRVVVNVRPVYGSQFLLSCNAALIEDEGDPVFQDTHNVRLLRKWPYEQLLLDIKTQLGE